MEAAFFAFPDTPVDADGAFTDRDAAVRLVPWTEANYRAVRDSWRADGAQTRAEIWYTSEFRRLYRLVVEMARTRLIAEEAEVLAGVPAS